MIYLDANLFIFARVDEGKMGKLAREILAAVDDGKISAMTSCLAIDEVIWIVRKQLDYAKAIKYGESLFCVPNLKIVSVCKEDILRSFILMKQGLKPRDAIHAAVALNHGVFTIASEDSDFENVKGLTLCGFEECAKRLC